MKKLFAQIMKFGIVGFLAFFIDYGVMIALTELVGIPSTISSMISFCISAVFNYICSTVFVFETDKEANKVVQFIVFFVLSIIGLGINTLIMYVGTPILDRFIPKAYMIVKIFATGVVMVYNFISRKIFLEKKN